MLKEGVKVGLARLNDDTVKSCSAVRESSEGDVEVGVVEPSDAKAKACSVVKKPSLPLEGEEVGLVGPLVVGVKAKRWKKRRVKAGLSKDGRGRGQRRLKRPVAVVV